jgi:hypothetical protein
MVVRVTVVLEGSERGVDFFLRAIESRRFILDPEAQLDTQDTIEGNDGLLIT